MKKSDIPFYSDPHDFEDCGNDYPCDTEFMVYNPLVHKYFLTREGLAFYGVEAERKYISSNPNKVEELIMLTTKKIYDTIQYLVGAKNYEIILYRIAVTPQGVDKYAFRKDFENVLVSQAKHIIEMGDSAMYSHNDEAGKVAPEGQWRNLNDISQEALRSLDAMGLTRSFIVSSMAPLDKNKY